MDTWQRILQKSLTSAKEIAERFDIPLADVEKIQNEFDIKINPYYLSLIKEKGDPIYKQVVPDLRELDDHGLFFDPLAEDRDSPVKSIVHRYPDRCLFLVSHDCASFCRFCTRKRKVGDPTQINPKFIDEGIDYIEKHSEIRDVIMSGGDPLLLSDDWLKYILHKLRRIPHVEIIRIGTRVPCFLPQRITAKLANLLKKFHPLYMNVHFNHPDELTPIAVKALGRLADAGIPLGCQTVLLKGVNDDPQVMKKLMQKLLMARVRPYYIYQADYVYGTEHFRTRVEKGLEIIQAIRGWTSGLAVPHFVIDSPGGGGKIPLLPEYVVKITDEEVVMRNYQGKIFRYTQPKETNGKHDRPEQLITDPKSNGPTCPLLDLDETSMV
ncbi:MAG: KamA family radical SAM protein [candidate division KSB1 bacterium]|nr:KamA family radical SAM protein [candidate division KSB1 bacterium]MDZ7335460.1 KamA family radical SAM protein [candidate division KSB1 bacterium]MDZ7358762.1 KamA family radical SAM protein [candidate division KSB1 bacterium]MDZ7400298.1 KamA family radical SAM protein [candidate division KSB1 bacterium]